MSINKKIVAWALTILAGLAPLPLFGQPSMLYKDSSKPVDVRVNDLMKRMTLKEKVQQLQSQLIFLPKYAQDRDFTVGHFRNVAHFMHLNGSATASACAAAINEDTRRSIAASRLGIPVLQHGEACHGAQWGMATCFPQCIGMAATFDDSLVYEAGKVVAQELRAVGVRQVYAPVINIARDPRWGRMQETYGEDVFLTSRMGVAYTKALQKGGVIATLKHFVDNYGDGGHDSYASENSWRVLREIYLEPFRACIQEAGAGGVMAAYNSVDGMPCSANGVLLDSILRKEWKFRGIVVSDYGGINGVYSAHHVTASLPAAEAACLKAGLDVMLPNGYRDLPGLVSGGMVSKKDIDRSVRRVLTAKFRLGLFDHPFADTAAADQVVRSPEHRQMALEVARKTMTLLKNDSGALPLDEHTVKRIGVFGPAGNVMSLGDYSGPYGGWKGEDAVTPYQGLVNRLNGKAEVVLCPAGKNPLAMARTCDVLIYFATIQEGEGGDRSKLELPAMAVHEASGSDHAIIVDSKAEAAIQEDQEKTILALAATGIKTIVVLLNGAPIDVRHWIGQVNTVLEAWYPGEQGGTAIAEALMGDIDPGGRLPVTWPKQVGQVPMYYAIKPSGRGYAYLDDDGKPQWPFGFGLGYTHFEYSNLIVPGIVNGDTSIRVTVTNTGDRPGDEVVELYLHQERAPVTRPIRELKAFKRVTLAPRESREVVLTLPYRSFGYWNKDLHFVITPGIFKLYIARDAEHTVLEKELNVE